MLEFDLPLVKADRSESLVYCLINALDALVASGQCKEEHSCHGLVTLLTPTCLATAKVSKVRNTLFKLAHVEIDIVEVENIMREHGYQLTYRRQAQDPLKAEVVANTPRGVLCFPIL